MTPAEDPSSSFSLSTRSRISTLHTDLRLGRLNTEKHKHRKCQTQDPAFAFGCVAFGCVWIHSAFAAFAFGCVLRLGVLRLPAFGSGSAFAAFSTSAFGPRVHHSAFGMILRLRLAAFAFGCFWGILRLAAFDTFFFVYTKIK